jgi:hypothetical protein
MKVKVHTGVDEETNAIIHKRAKELYGGNFSLALRLLIEDGIRFNKERDDVEYTKAEKRVKKYLAMKNKL